MSQINVTFGNTFAGRPNVQVPIEAGTTLGAFLATQGGIPEGAILRVNRNSESNMDRVLNGGEVVTISPAQIKGA